MIAGAACTDTDSATDLNAEGPPMIRQVRLTERYLDSAMVERTRRVFAFGTHALAFSEEVHPVQTAVASGNGLRVVIDELLVGNNLEELQCRGVVDDDAHPTFGRVPPGADPDDVARCAAENDALKSTCKGSDGASVCICRRATGCLRGVAMVPEGEPVGVQDANLDGSADDMRFIPGAAGIQCGAISVPLSYETNDVGSRTYWNPSGDQNRPAMGGFDVLGPAIVLVPLGPLPTSLRCGLVFSEAVVDKQGIQVCAPPDGDIAAGCTPGDVGAFTFGVEPLAIRPNSFVDGAMNVSRIITLIFAPNAPVDATTVAGIQIAPAPPGTATITAPLGTSIRIAFAMPLAAQTEYSVTLPTTITDTYGQPLPEAKTYRFTTGI
jgi:hypothetical protein